MTSAIPNPDLLHPSTRSDLGNVVFLKAAVSSALIEVGDFTYYDTEGNTSSFEEANVKYLYGPQRLVIGRFTALGPGATFIMPGGSHPMIGPSTYPFTMFGGTWSENTLEVFRQGQIELAGDTVVGNDVWIGRGATIMPGVRIGDGAVVGACSVVTKDVAAYDVVAGNPARVRRSRFDRDDIERLLAARWWDWPIEMITEHAATIMSGTPRDIERLAAGMEWTAEGTPH